MEFFVSFHDIRLFQWIAMIVSASLAVVMLLIKVPHTEHATRLTRAKSLVALSYMFCAFIFGYTLSHHDIEQYGLFSAMTLLINVAFSTATLSFSLINLLGHRYVDFSKLLVSIFAIFIVSMALIEVFFNGEKNVFNIVLVTSIAMFTSMCIYYIIIFDKWYRHSIMMLEKYYDEDIFIAAGRRIRNIAKEADTLEPTERVEKISSLFSNFKNPDKETVLTPWRVVNMHMSDIFGGYDFFDENHEYQIDEPRFVNKGKVTEDIFNKSSVFVMVCFFHYYVPPYRVLYNFDSRENIR